MYVLILITLSNASACAICSAIHFLNEHVIRGSSTGHFLSVTGVGIVRLI